MAATTDVWSYHGTPFGSATTEAASDLTNDTFRHKRQDNDTQDLNGPIVLPTGAGTAYGWRKHTKLAVKTAPDQKIENLRWFADADPDATWTGVTLLAGATADAGYVQGSASDNGTPIPWGSDADSIGSGAPITLNSGAIIGTSTDTGVPWVSGAGYTQDLICTQLGATSEASSGLITSRTVRYRYDET